MHRKIHHMWGITRKENMRSIVYQVDVLWWAQPVGLGLTLSEMTRNKVTANFIPLLSPAFLIAHESSKTSENFVIDI